MSRDTAFVLVFGLLLVAAFVPVFAFTFGLHNDYAFFLPAGARPWWLAFFESHHLVAVGRPLGAVLLNLQGLLFRSVHDFATGRCLTSILTAAGFLVLSWYLMRRVGVAAPWACLVGFVSFLLPPSQLFFIWLANFVPGTLNTVFAMVTYLLLDGVDPRTCSSVGSRVAQWFRLLAGLTLLLASLCIYPPTTLFFLVFPAARALFSPLESWPVTRFKVLRDIGVLGVSMAAYFLLVSLLITPLMADRLPELDGSIRRNKDGPYRFELASSLSTRGTVIVDTLALAAAGVWHPRHGEAAARSIGLAGTLLWLALLAAELARARRPEGRPPGNRVRWALESATAVALLLLLSMAPLLASAGGSVAVVYRTTFPAAVIVLLWLVAPLHHLVRLLPYETARITSYVVVITGTAGCLVLAEANLLCTARNASLECEAVSQRVRDHPGEVREVQFVARPRGEPLVGESLRNEFGYLMTESCHVAGLIAGLDPGRRHDEGTTQAFLWRLDDPRLRILVDDATALVDLHRIGRPDPSHDASRNNVIRVSAPDGAPGADGRARNLVDGDVRTSWCAPGVPRAIRIRVPRRLRLTSYAILADSSSGGPFGVPAAWILSGSPDGLHWVQLDSRSAPSDRITRVDSVYPVRVPPLVRFLTLVVTRSTGPGVRIHELVLSGVTVDD